MKRLLFLLAVAAPLFAVTTNEDCRGYQQLATLYQVRELMIHGAGDSRIDDVIDDQLAVLRRGWVRWVAPDHDAPRDKKVHVVAAANGSTTDNFEAASEHPFEVKVVVPAKRSLLNKNNPVYVGTLHVTYSTNGRTRTKDLPVNAWMNPDTSNTLDLGGIADHAEAAVTASTRNPGEAVVEIHFVQAVAEDDPANPAYDTIQSLAHVRRYTDANTIDDEIAKAERTVLPNSDPIPLTHLVRELHRANDMLRSNKEDEQKKGQKLLEETLRRMGTSVAPASRNDDGIFVVDTTMRARVQKWGNSLGLRIPKPFAEETHLEENGEVEISVKGGKLIAEAIEPDFTLKALLDQITPENRHGEISTGKRVGKEVW